MSEMYIDIQKSNAFVRKVLWYMVFGLLITLATPFALLQFAPNLFRLGIEYGNILVLVELALVFFLSFRIYSMAAGTVKLLLVIYALLNGVTLSYIGLLYDPFVIFYALAITLTVFTVSAIYGFRTSEDLSSYSRFFKVGLISLILLSLLNIWLQADLLYWGVTVVGTVLFTGLIAYDMNRIRNLSFYLAEENGENTDVYAAAGALSLYLDFINLFLYILRFFGRKR